MPLCLASFLFLFYQVCWLRTPIFLHETTRTADSPCARAKGAQGRRKIKRNSRSYEESLMRSRSILLLALALGCGLVASIGISQVMEARNKPSGEDGDMQPIFVAMADINAN